MLSPHLSVEVHEEGVAIRVRHCMLVIPIEMAREYATEVLRVANEARAGGRQLPEAKVLGQDGKPTKIEI